MRSSSPDCRPISRSGSLPESDGSHYASALLDKTRYGYYPESAMPISIPQSLVSSPKGGSDFDDRFESDAAGHQSPVESYVREIGRSPPMTGHYMTDTADVSGKPHASSLVNDVLIYI